MSKATRTILIMGVAGVGKSTPGSALARRLNLPFIEGDDLHSPEARAKMQAGTPLNDADRWPWLARIAAAASHRDSIVACSALKQSYRSFLREKIGHPVTLVYLAADEKRLKTRIQQRSDHFMPTSLIASQLKTLEPPSQQENAYHLDAHAPIAHNIDVLVEALK